MLSSNVCIASSTAGGELCTHDTEQAVPDGWFHHTEHEHEFVARGSSSSSSCNIVRFFTPLPFLPLCLRVHSTYTYNDKNERRPQRPPVASLPVLIYPSFLYFCFAFPALFSAPDNAGHDSRRISKHSSSAWEPPPSPPQRTPTFYPVERSEADRAV